MNDAYIQGVLTDGSKTLTLRMIDDSLEVTIAKEDETGFVVYVDPYEFIKIANAVVKSQAPTALNESN